MLYGFRPVLCVGGSGWDIMGLYSGVWGSSGMSGTKVAEVAVPSGRLWLMNVNFCQARSLHSLGSIRELGWTHKNHIHTYIRKGKDNPHLTDGWYGSRTTHRFSISVPSHSALSLILPAPINLQTHACLFCFNLDEFLVCFPFSVLYSALFLPFCFLRDCADTSDSSFVSLSLFQMVLFLLTWHWDSSCINQSLRWHEWKSPNNIDLRRADQVPAMLVSI